jgi:hypothetical protein
MAFPQLPASSILAFLRQTQGAAEYAEASLIREAFGKMFREGCEDAAGATRAKNVTSSKNPVRLTPRHSE